MENIAMSYASALSNPKLSEILQQLIEEKGLTITELARRIQISQPTIQRIATGVYKRPHAKTLKPIAEFFKISIDQLQGLEPILWLKSKSIIRQIPLLTPSQAFVWPDAQDKSYTSAVVIDIEAGTSAYAMEMPDPSMEPLVPKRSILIIDPTKEPRYRSYVAVKLQHAREIMIRQLLIDSEKYYIKPLSSDFEQFKMTPLSPEDSIAGVVVQVRLNCAD
jgi:SOS-response transcriptional repressor LexA